MSATRNIEAAKADIQQLFDLTLERIDVLGNRFERTSWGDFATARREMDTLRRHFFRGEAAAIRVLKLIWAPTSDMQELSLTGGWGRQYLRDARGAERTLNRYLNLIQPVEA